VAVLRVSCAARNSRSDFAGRKLLLKVLNYRENRQIKFTIIRENNERKTSLQALRRARFDFDFKQIKPPAKTEDVLRELKDSFKLLREPRKIEAFDAAHISGTDFTAAKSVWENGKFAAEENEFWLLDEASELESLQKAIGERFSPSKFSFPDLLLIDGGKSQLQAALKALSFLENREFIVIGAVKPPQRHAEISHFLLENGETVKFSGESEAMRILLRLRDEAHGLANKIHRQRRESAHFYELAKILPSITEGERRILLQKFGSLKNLSEASRKELENFVDGERLGIVLKDLQMNRENLIAGVKPVIVPIRFDDPNGDAKDLQPLNYQAKQKKF
jgi:excinuclease ABC subunit C